jgi:7-keto-8-aminopelargonate synthetase-like enzyme
VEDWRRESIAARAAQLHRGLLELGYDVGPRHDSPIVPIRAAGPIEAGLLWRALQEQGVYTNCVIPPAVPRSVLRTSVMATHTEADIDRALEAFARCAPVRS